MTATEQGALSIEDTMRYLGGISRRQVYRLIESGDLTKGKIGRRTVITRPSCDAYLARITGGSVPA